MKYTKGIWKVKHEGEVGQAISRIYIVGKDDFAVARIADKEEREANAHLIAASPRMIEFIQKLAGSGNQEARDFIQTLDLAEGK